MFTTVISLITLYAARQEFVRHSIQLKGNIANFRNCLRGQYSIHFRFPIEELTYNDHSEHIRINFTFRTKKKLKLILYSNVIYLEAFQRNKEKNSKSEIKTDKRVIFFFRITFFYLFYFYFFVFCFLFFHDRSGYTRKNSRTKEGTKGR